MIATLMETDLRKNEYAILDGLKINVILKETGDQRGQLISVYTGFHFRF